MKCVDRKYFHKLYTISHHIITVMFDLGAGTYRIGGRDVSNGHG